MSIREITSSQGSLCFMFTRRKVALARQVAQYCRAGYPLTEVVPEQRNDHVNRKRSQTIHLSKVSPEVIDLALVTSCPIRCQVVQVGRFLSTSIFPDIFQTSKFPWHPVMPFWNGKIFKLGQPV